MVANRFAGEMRILGGKIVTYGEALNDGGVRSEIAPLIVTDQQGPVLVVERGKHHPGSDHEKRQDDHPIPERRPWDERANKTRASAGLAADQPDRAKGQREKTNVSPENGARSPAKQPGGEVGKPGTQEQADDDRGGEPLRHRDKTEAPPAKLVAEIDGKNEVKEREHN